MNDFKNITMEQPYGIVAAPDADSILRWHATIQGPPETHWEGEELEVVLDFPESYPNHPPKVSFLKDIHHPNVCPDGTVCADFLSDKWSPDSDVLSILISLQVFLASPNLLSAANREAVEILSRDGRYMNLFIEHGWDGHRFHPSEDFADHGCQFTVRTLSEDEGMEFLAKILEEAVRDMTQEEWDDIWENARRMADELWIP
jgi:ubiquitin-protein ligase